MRSRADREERADDPERILEEYLAALSTGAPHDIDAFAARAGPRAQDLRERLELARDLDRALRLLRARRRKRP